ncbi:MAG TPA: hypothetical protein V6D23_25615 [Candidatus Obscuribacterales bacterium]
MARKFRSPGKQYKGFGQPRENPAPAAVKAPAAAAKTTARSAPDRSWLASRMEMLNMVMFTFFAILGYVQYFVHQAPAANSLAMGIGFTLILVLYLFLIRHRRNRRQS